MKKCFEKVKEEFEKTKKDFELERGQLQKTLTDQNREIENKKAGTLLFSGLDCNLFRTLLCKLNSRKYKW